MWIVRLALARPYTFVVMALLLVLLGGLAVIRTPTDIFPAINIPVVSTVWAFSGLPADEMADRMIGNFERALTTTVNDIEHSESQSLNGVGVVKIFFHPNVNIDVALSQVTAIAQTLLRTMPPGTTPPLILSFNASSVPIMQLALSSNILTEQELFDAANTVVRTQLAVVQGAALPFPYGGKVRQVQVDLDNKALQAQGLEAQDVSNALGAQNLILPAGTQKIDQYEYNIKLNASPKTIDELNDLPIKIVNGATVYIHDVAHVRDGFAPQTNVVRVDGKRAVLMTIQKIGNASTLEVIRKIKALVPKIQSLLPPGVDMHVVGDQSLFVQSAIESVVHETLIAGVLTGLMILLFIGSWRSTLIITISIPLAILASIITLSALGETINIMTLGGLALAVGILVDDATVEIENINRNLEEGKPVTTAILDGAQQIAVPALVATLAICIVFVPMFLLSGVSRYLFVPLAEAVVFAMIASYLLSRTLVPTLAQHWLKPHGVSHGASHGTPQTSKNVFVRFQHGFEEKFEKLRGHYHGILAGILGHRRVFVAAVLGFVVVSLVGLVPWLGNDFFPSTDSGQIKLHLRAHSGMRVEETARLCDAADAVIRQVIPASDTDSIVHNIGLPNSGINLAYSNSAPIGPNDADIFISLKPGHAPTPDYVRSLRVALNAALPGVSFAFLPADIVGQILNFGLPAPVDVQLVGNTAKKQEVRDIASHLLASIRSIAGVVDGRIQQPVDYPEWRVTVDRARAQDLGITQRAVASDLLISLSGSFQTAPSFWVDPKNGVSYNIVTQTPQYSMTGLDDLRAIPIIPDTSRQKGQILAALAGVTRGVGAGVVSHYNVQPIIDIYAGVQDRDLGGVAHAVAKVVAGAEKTLPKGISLKTRGQIQTMDESFSGLFTGLIFAVLLVYLLMVVNFQSWWDPFIIITALPGAIAGIVWMLFLTHTSVSVPALIGTIMCMGVATANSILIVSFAREKMREGADAVTAALEAGFVRLRPVLMTAMAMIIGMIPMAMNLGEGGEQNAPLGRAVIGGLMFATLATLFVVPAVFSLIHGLDARHAPPSPHHQEGNDHVAA